MSAPIAILNAPMKLRLTLESLAKMELSLEVPPTDGNVFIDRAIKELRKAQARLLKRTGVAERVIPYGHD